MVATVRFVSRAEQHLLNVCLYYLRHRKFSQALTLDGPGQRTAYTLYRVAEGSLRASAGDKQVVIRQGSWMLTPPGWRCDVTARSVIWYACFDIVHRHRFIQPGDGGGVTVTVDPGAPIQPDWSAVTSSSPPLVLPDSAVHSAEGWLLRAYADYWRSAQGLNRANALIQAWLADWFDELEAPDGRVTRNQLRWYGQVVNTMQSSVGEGLTVSQLAERFGMARSTFTQRFTDHGGEAPGAMLDRLRIERAKRLLSSTALPMIKIARRCGFRDRSAFARRFRQVVGESPSMWRRQQTRSAG